MKEIKDKRTMDFSKMDIFRCENGREYYVDEKGIYYPVIVEDELEASGMGYFMKEYTYEDGEKTSVFLPYFGEEEEEEILTYWQELRLEYLQETKKAKYNLMIIKNQMDEHLESIQKQVDNFMKEQAPTILEAYGLSEELKKSSLQEYNQKYQLAKREIEDTIKRTIIFI